MRAHHPRHLVPGLPGLPLTCGSRCPARPARTRSLFPTSDGTLTFADMRHAFKASEVRRRPAGSSSSSVAGGAAALPAGKVPAGEWRWRRDTRAARARRHGAALGRAALPRAWCCALLKLGVPVARQGTRPRTLFGMPLRAQSTSGG